MWSIQSFCEQGRVDLFSDLDNTLIYSHRRPLPHDKVVVEQLNGVDQSFMTGRTLNFFQHTPWVQLIPVTTRSRKQFARIAVLGREIPCKYALVCNGGVLLVDGEPDKAWLEETKQLAGAELTALSKALEVLKSLVSPEHIHMPEGLMVYTRCRNSGTTAKRLRVQIDGALLNVLHSHGKVYVIPQSLNKGAAVERFKHRYQTGFVAAAGDSIFDIPLLNAADLAVFPPILKEFVRCPCTVTLKKGVLSDCLCTALENLYP